VDVIDFEARESYKSTYKTEVNSAKKLIHTPYFNTDIIELRGSQVFNYSHLDSFVILICVEGNASLEYNRKEYNLALGKTILIPASLSSITLNSPSAKILQVSI
jgi:mannose-6-phosphate isomerase